MPISKAEIRAGLIEHWARDLLIETGVGERLQRESLFHRGIHFCFDGALHHIDFMKLVGQGVTVYGQQEVIKDLVARRLADGGQILFDVADVAVHDLTGTAPRITFKHDGKAQEIACDFIGGCDGFHGICRPSIPDGVLTVYDREYPFGWVGILSELPPADDELIYAYHDRGFALYTMRSPSLARLYIQCAYDDDIANWPDRRIWDELHARLGGTRTARRGQDRRQAPDRDAQRRGRADAARPAVSRRRFRPHPAADRRQGHEPRAGGRRGARPRDHGVFQIRPQRPSRALFADVPAPRLEGAAVLMVDDADAAPRPQRQRVRPQAPAWASLPTW